MNKKGIPVWMTRSKVVDTLASVRGKGILILASISAKGVAALASVGGEGIAALFQLRQRGRYPKFFSGRVKTSSHDRKGSF